MEKKFAKLFDLENGGQVLYTSNFDNEDEEVPYYIEVRCDYKGMVANMKLGYKTNKTMRKIFDTVSQSDAESTFNNVVKQFA